MDFNKIKEMGLEYAEKGKNAALDLAEKGKTQALIVNEQGKLLKAQRQLGALVYSLHKAGEENLALVEKYINAVAEVEKAIEEIKANMTDDERAEVETQETAETEEAPAEEPAAEKNAESEETIEEEPIHLRGETKICPVCKAEVDGDAMFCNHCGAQL